MGKGQEVAAPRRPVTADGEPPLPQVTICIPVFNRRQTIERALRSALRQDINDVEVVVVDNASTDGTYEFVRDLQLDRVIVRRNSENIGMYGNFQRCAALAVGRFIRFLASDDELSDNCLGREIDLMCREPSIGVLSTRGVLVNQGGRVVGSTGNFFSPGVWRGSYAARAVVWALSHYGFNPLNYPSGIMVRRSAFVASGGFNTSLTTAADVDCWVRILRFADLGVSEHVGCRITLHHAQGGHALFLNGAYLREQVAILDSNLDLFPDSKRLRSQFAARGVWFVIKCLTRGKLAAARTYLRIVRELGVSAPSVFHAIVRHLALRFALRIANSRRIPTGASESYRPSRPARDPVSSQRQP